MLLYGVCADVFGLVMLQLERSRSLLRVSLASVLILLATGISGWIVISVIPADSNNNYVQRLYYVGTDG